MACIGVGGCIDGLNRDRVDISRCIINITRHIRVRLAVETGYRHLISQFHNGCCDADVAVDVAICTYVSTNGVDDAIYKMQRTV